jgi:hypothetical protein
VYIQVDWNNAPLEFIKTVQIIVSSSVGDYEHVHLPVIRRELQTESFTGFVESDKCISIPATHFSPPEKGSQYRILPFLGRTEFGAVERGHVRKNPSTTDIGFLEYDFYVFTDRTQSPKLILYFTTTLDTDTSNPLTYEVMVDNKSYGELRLMEDAPKIGELPPGWIKAVQDCVWTRTIDLHETFQTGKHVVKVRLCNQNLLLEKLVVDLGGVRESYLGPPPSTFVKNGHWHS